MENDFPAIISIVFLVAAIALGFIKGMNTGVVAMSFALIASVVCGISDKELRAGFPTNMFLILFGTMFLFAVAQKTGVIHLVARKVIAAVGNKSWLLPWAIFFLTLIVSGIGAGPAPAIAIVSLPAISLAVEMGVSPFLFGVMYAMGANAGASSPISTAGIVAQGLVENYGWRSLQPDYFINCAIGHFLAALACYILLKGWKIKPRDQIDKSQIGSLNKNQWISLLGILVFVILVVVFRKNVGLTALIVGLGLIMMKVVSSDREIIQSISWNTLLLICGVSVLMNIVVETRGIELIINFLSMFMTEYTAKPVISISAGIMSWFCTTTSVVMPTLIPTIPGLLQNIKVPIDPVTLVSALTTGSFSAAISPLSAGGGLILATYVQLTNCSAKEQTVLFRKLFMIAVFCVAVMAVVAFLPIYR